jgi:origin recognition complex subunit 2
MPPRAKKARLSPPEEDRFEHEPEQEAEDSGPEEASHLVSFLTGYDATRPNDHGEINDQSSDEEHDHEALHEEDEEEEEEDPDEDDDVDATPTKRAKTGLVGTSTPNSRKTTPRKKGPAGTGTPNSTPRKRKTANPLRKLEEMAQEGIIRLSKSDMYFITHSRSSKTSGNSYSALAPPLSSKLYDQYTRSARRTGVARAQVVGLEADSGARFDQWQLELEKGFNLLMYGYGSKRGVLNDFARRLKSEGHVVVVDGHYPQLTLREVLGQIEDMLSIPSTSASGTLENGTPIEKLVNRIYAYFLPPTAIPNKKRSEWKVSDRPLYLVIHNIDSTSLRNPRSLAILSLLACSPRIHLVASFDHLHTPLLFSATQMTTPSHVYADGTWSGSIPPERGFNWLYHNVTTFADYDHELAHQRLSTTASLTSSSLITEEAAAQILLSVPPNALRLLKLLVTRQIASLPSDAKFHTAYPGGQGAIAPVFGVDNDILAKIAREKFIAREEERYNALIGEYRDHGLVVEANTDSEGRGGRWVWVPMGKAGLERLLQGLSTIEV